MKPQHRGITQNFTDHLLKGTPLLAEGYEGINGLAISNAIMLSSWKGCEVDLDDPAIDDEFYEILKGKIATSRRKENIAEEQVANLEGTYGSN
jgi:hypothetical protein